MTSYLGPAGSLIEFKCPSAEEITRADNVSLDWTLGGVQKAQYGARAPRSWRLSLATATPEQLSGLAGLAAGLYGPPPWVYVGSWAQVTNLLTPPASVCAPGSWSGAGIAGGPVDLAGAPRPVLSVLNANGGAIILPAVPVVAGVPVTGSVWAVGVTGFSTELIFRDAAGVWISALSTTHPAPAGGALLRRSITRTPPSNAAYAELRVLDALRAAQPAITWTPDLASWSVGGGAPKVIARGLSQSVQLAVRDEPYMRRASASFNLEEVGNA